MRKYFLAITLILLFVTGCGSDEDSPKGSLTCTAKNKIVQYETIPTYSYTFQFNEGETVVESIVEKIIYEYDESINVEEKIKEIEAQECSYNEHITTNCSAVYEDNKVIVTIVMDPLSTNDNRKTMSKAEAKQRYESGNYDVLREPYSCK